MGAIGVTQLGGALLTAWNTYKIFTRPEISAPEAGAWRPPQWDKPQLTSLSVPASGTNAQGQQGYTFKKTVTAQTTYFFDAVSRVDHVQGVRMTEHPVQTGANIVDHAYLLPAVVTLEIGMSDAMDRYSAGMYTSDVSKSVSAYQQLVKLQKARVPMTLTTRLASYPNMLIESIESPDDNKTRHGLRALVRMRQILTATVSTKTVSTRPQQSDASNIGPVACHKPTNAMQANNEVSASGRGGIPVDLKASHVPGAGTYSSKGIQNINAKGMGSGSIW